MTGPMVRETVTLAGRAERARVARALVGAVLGPGHPVRGWRPAQLTRGQMPSTASSAPEGHRALVRCPVSPAHSHSVMLVTARSR